MTTANLKAFVIGPIGDKEAADGTLARVAYEEGVQILEEVIIPACTAFGIEAVRADMIAKTGEIPEQIFRHLRDAPVVIADLTGANPNVMYELGLRHTTGKLTVQIGEKGRLPFDVAAIRTIMFKRTEAGLVQARKDLAKVIGANLDSGGDPVTATRVWFETSRTEMTESAIVEASDQAEGENSEEDAPGFLELIAETEIASQSLAQTMTAATTITEDIARVYSEATESVRQADARGGGAAARLALANRTASDLGGPALRLEIVAGDYAQTVARIEPGLKYLLERLAEDPKQIAEAPEFPKQMRALVTAAASTVEGALAMGSNAAEIGKASKSLRQVGRRLAASFKKMAETSGRVAGWRQLLDQLPVTENVSTQGKEP
ncbi:hypothetical protein [Ramlibacter tataouinensis]|uniref:Uncharacterized protein n=1 Tax=Ramlibacter tataouinensis (strain ATCC BAA-407 / DSM 14655 / LMG 21543 / TTB310) TaxID=365046 RepID=F5Y456_RAMTT|nr:hypothetical protein [Ramlibacter tataouinensis]AEG92521.1 Hypothetical protein Rta_14315 [Ramlibacter tataouinensis TTB310]